MADTQFNSKNIGPVAENKQITNDENIEPLCMEKVLSESNKQLKITDVNQFCLEHVFMYLDWEDLLNVAHANKHLRLATVNPFAQKYGRMLIEFRLTGKKPIIDKSDEIIIQDLKIIFRMLRCFGQSITKLKADYREWCYKSKFRNYHRILNYMNEFGTESLTNIEFDPALGFEQLKKPFANVEELKIRRSFLQKKCLSAIFPKLRRLIFHIPSIENDFRPIVTDYFPNLQYLEIDFDTSWRYTAVAALRLNSHVKSLRIGIPSFSFLEEISEHLQSIENLDIFIGVYPKQSRQLESNLIHFQSVKRFSIYFRVITKIVLPKLPFLFDQLKEFVLDGVLKYNDFYNDFLSGNPAIDKLTLDYERLNGIANPKELQRMLPSLKEINFVWECYNIDDILQHWTNDLKTVERFSFICINTEEEVKKYPTSEWHIIVSRQDVWPKMVTLERPEALTHNTPFPLFYRGESSRFYQKLEFLFCNCDCNRAVN